MDLILQPSAPQCAVTGTEFAEGDRVVSYLGHGEDGAVARWDLLASAEDEFTPPPAAICRWVHVFKPRLKEENQERNLKLGAESLFTTLCDPAVELGEENVPLVQFLALMLERKKVIRPKGLTADRARRVFEHAKSKQLYEVPVGDLTPEFFIKVQKQLGVLVGEPKKKDSTVPVAKPADEPGTPTPGAEPEAQTPPPPAEPQG